MQIFTRKPDGTTFRSCDKCRATDRKYNATHKTKIKKRNAKSNPKYNPKNNAKKSEMLAERRYKIAVKIAQKNKKRPNLWASARSQR